ncbi:MAG: UDP-3-O-acyl-N-acetylglucosamine deacetylase [Pseudomonadota bacterium]
MQPPLNDVLPNKMPQKTIQSVVSLDGLGVHSGECINLSIYPAAAGSGITFVRTDVKDKNNVVPARWDRVVDTHFCTCIANEAGVHVRTIEHIMAALYACEIDNARLEVSGTEVPIVDGSSAPFVHLIEKVGVQEQSAPRRVIEVLKSVTVHGDAIGGNDRRYVTFHPANHFSAAATHEFDGCADLLPQNYIYEGNVATFKAQIMRARTFGFMQDVEKLWSSGLAKGASLDNAVVIDGSRVLNKEGFRYPNECVRHKILDAVGDLYLAGAPIQGRYEGLQCGHGLNNQLLRAFFADASAWRLHTFESDSEAIHFFAANIPTKAAVAC